MPVPNLRTNQRNIVRLIAQHMQRYPGATCYLGHFTSSRQNVYLKALESLEEKGLISVERTGPMYKHWKLKLLIPLEDVLGPTK